MKKTASSPKASNNRPAAVTRRAPSHEEISKRAAAIWQKRGCPESRDEEIWLEAERQLSGLSEPGRDDKMVEYSEALAGVDIKTDDLPGELEKRFPGPGGREATSL